MHKLCTISFGQRSVDRVQWQFIKLNIANQLTWELKYCCCRIIQAGMWGHRDPSSPHSTGVTAEPWPSQPWGYVKEQARITFGRARSRNILIAEAALTRPRESWAWGKKKEAAFIFWRILQHFPSLGLEVLPGPVPIWVITFFLRRLLPWMCIDKLWRPSHLGSLCSLGPSTVHWPSSWLLWGRPGSQLAASPSLLNVALMSVVFLDIWEP